MGLVKGHTGGRKGQGPLRRALQAVQAGWLFGWHGAGHSERRTKLLSIMGHDMQPPCTSIMKQRSIFRRRLLSHSCSTDILRKSFVPRVIRLFSFEAGGSWVLAWYCSLFLLYLTGYISLVFYTLPVTLCTAMAQSFWNVGLFIRCINSLLIYKTLQLKNSSKSICCIYLGVYVCYRLLMNALDFHMSCSQRYC